MDSEVQTVESCRQLINNPTFFWTLLVLFLVLGEGPLAFFELEGGFLFKSLQPSELNLLVTGEESIKRVKQFDTFILATV